MGKLNHIGTRKIQHDFFNHQSKKISAWILEPNICPLCKTSLKPIELSSGCFCDGQNNDFLSILYLCNSCYNSFIVQYKIGRNDNDYLGIDGYIAPNKFIGKEFEKEICDISPMFVEIYNQSLHAENLEMATVAGIGYRLALEYLIKDFFIYIHPDDKEKITNIKTLSTFFSDENSNTYKIDNHKLNKTAMASIWVANDFAHYQQKYENYDLQGLKGLIDLTLYYISAELKQPKIDDIINAKKNVKNQCHTGGQKRAL